MPIERVAGTDLRYYLLAFDAQSQERLDDPDGQMSQRALEVLTREPVTDVFCISHGWMGDVPAARLQYNRWIGAMAACADDMARVQQVRPGFRPLLLGLHWPSLPWGDEELQRAHVSFGLPGPALVDDRIEQYAARLADTPAAREALRTILSAASIEPMAAELPSEVAEAYRALYQQAGLASQDVDAAPGADHAAFDPNGVFEEAKAADEESAVSFGLGAVGDLLAPLRLMSYWKMKARAQQFGVSAGAAFLGALQRAVRTERRVRFHLMGHSFGCVVASAMLHGASTSGMLMQPVDTLLLAQGAVSLWSYCADIPYKPGHAGYFRSIISNRCVSGPIITTQSIYDTALSRSYPMGSRVAGQVDFGVPGAYPKYGAVGLYGLRGSGLEIVDHQMLGVQEHYEFVGGMIYNLEGSAVICEGSGGAGAHNDIAKPAVTHAFWEAIQG